MTVDEIVADLKHSNLPLILVEGDHDCKIYRWILERLGMFEISIQPVGGRSKLLAVYERRNEFSHRNTRITFIADRDMYIFDNEIPAEYDGIVWTFGYSIENDLYAPNIRALHRMLDSSELKRVRRIISAVIEWFAFEVEQYKMGRPTEIAIHINRVLDEDDNLNEDFLSSRNYVSPSESIRNDLTEHYPIKLRGKTIIDIYARVFNDPHRSPKWSKAHIIEWLVGASHNNEYIDTLLTSIRTKLGLVSS
jgi:hypothetical protein